MDPQPNHGFPWPPAPWRRPAAFGQWCLGALTFGAVALLVLLMTPLGAALLAWLANAVRAG